MEAVVFLACRYIVQFMLLEHLLLGVGDLLRIGLNFLRI